MGNAGLLPDEEGGGEYPVTSATSAQFGGYTLVHELSIQNEEMPSQRWRHRAVLRIHNDADFEKHGHWVDESGISYVKHNDYTYCVATDLWHPQFPEFFQVCGPYSQNGSTTDVHPTEPVFDAGVTETHPMDKFGEHSIQPADESHSPRTTD